MWRKLRTAGVLSIVASMILLTGCSNTPENTNAAAEEKAIPVKVANVEFGALTASDQLSGTILPESEVEVLPKAMGEIKRIFVEKGDIVKKGDVIAQLDDTNEQNEVKQQQISLEQAQAGLKSAQNTKTRAENSYSQAELSLKTAEKSLEQAYLSKGDNLSNIEIQINNAQNSWEQANTNLNRMKALYDDGLISLQDYENAVNAEKSAKNALDQLELSKEQAGRGDNITTQESAVEQAKISLKNAESSVKDAEIGVSNAQIAVEQAQLALQSAKDRLDDKVIKATITGEVTNVEGEVGAMATSSSPFATIVSKGAVKLSINIPSNQLASFKIGNSVDVKVTGLEGTFKGKVTYVSSISSGYGLFTVDIKIEDKKDVIQPGMVASVLVEEIKQDDSIIIPAGSIIQKEGKSIVFIVTGDKVTQKEVEVLQYNTDFAAVNGDLKENDQIVVSGQNLLEDGNKVQIVEEE